MIYCEVCIVLENVDVAGKLRFVPFIFKLIEITVQCDFSSHVQVILT